MLSASVWSPSITDQPSWALPDGSMVAGLVQSECGGGAKAHVVGAWPDAKVGGTFGVTLWSCADCDCAGSTALFLAVPLETSTFDWAECQGPWHL